MAYWLTKLLIVTALVLVLAIAAVLLVLIGVVRDPEGPYKARHCWCVQRRRQRQYTEGLFNSNSSSRPFYTPERDDVDAEVFTPLSPTSDSGETGFISGFLSFFSTARFGGEGASEIDVVGLSSSAGGRISDTPTCTVPGSSSTHSGSSSPSDIDFSTLLNYRLGFVPVAPPRTAASSSEQEPRRRQRPSSFSASNSALNPPLEGEKDACEEEEEAADGISCIHHPTRLLLPPGLNSPLFHFASFAVQVFGLLLLVSDIIRRLVWVAWQEVWRTMTRHGALSRRSHLAGCSFKPAGFLQLFTGKHLNPKKCVTSFHWSEPVTVGCTVSFTIQFFQRNGRPYPVSDADNVLVEVTQGLHKVSLVTEVGGCSDKELHTVRCQFSARQAGEYSIAAMVAQTHVNGSPFLKKFSPGPPYPQHATLVGHSSTVVCEAMQQHALLLEPRDQYHNLCAFIPGQEEPSAYTLRVTEACGDDTDGEDGGGAEVQCGSVVSYDNASRRYTVHFLLKQPGCYYASLSYRGELLPQGSFTVIVLQEDDSQRVRRFVQRRQLDGLEAQLLLLPPSSSTLASRASPSPPPSAKHKKLYCYITPKQLILKEYLLKFIPKRMCTFRLCPSTKLDFSSKSADCKLPMLTLDDGCQAPVTLATKDRDVIAATFAQFMLKNIGGSETFKDKQDHFYHEVRKFHSKRPHDRMPIYVNREKLLESSMKATKNFTVSDWCKSLDVTFMREEALDWGGVGREWVELLGAELFDTSGGLFTSFCESSPQALVHPNPLRPAHLKLKHLEFAGRLVGKCLYESALGGKYHQTVRARFTRSFLAQIIGLRVHYTHFAQDDPELYQGKVQHLLQHGTSLLPEPLYFTDQQLTATGTLKTIELESGGATREVTNGNKLQYLDLLAQYRLATRVQHEMQAFLSGLNEIIPDNLLCIFDENELELLMCGTEQYSIADLKANHVVSGGSSDFKRVMYWFWTAIANFTEEEMARLLQFTTGCSRLPPGGFSQLSPQFQIMPTHTYNCLPIAHTCFNQLGLPDYDTYEQFEKCLLIAIKEGNEGFGLV